MTKELSPITRQDEDRKTVVVCFRLKPSLLRKVQELAYSLSTVDEPVSRCDVLRLALAHGVQTMTTPVTAGKARRR